MLLPLIFLVQTFFTPSESNLARRPEEYWRPAVARDISRYKPRHLWIDLDKHMPENFPTNPNKSQRKSNPKSTQANEDVECGIEGPPGGYDERIVGGYEAKPNQWPWQVAVFIDSAWFCGGSLISENYVLTAAHCVDGGGYFDIMAGAHNIRDSFEDHRVEVTSYNGWTHPNWSPNDLHNDIAIIELPTPIEWNAYIKPVCLPLQGDVAGDNDLVTCTGWGRASDTAGGVSPELRMVEDLPVINNEDCNDVYGIVGPGQVCIDTKGGKGTCSGDSGGACVSRWDSVRKPGDKWKQVGIISFGSSAGCEVGYPAGLTRVEYYLEWLCQETGVGCQ